MGNAAREHPAWFAAEDEIEFRPHSPEQEQALTFKTAIGVLACGIQFGKTKVGSVWMKIKNHTFTDPTDNALIVAPTYKILTQSTLPPYLDIMRGLGTFSKSDMAFHMNGGGTTYMRSGTDADSVVGITNVRAIWGDEAGLFTLYFAENLAARAAFKGAQTLYTTSPYTLNWLYKQYILPRSRNPAARPDVTLVQAASWQNPYFPKDVIERNRATMDPRRFNAMFGGQWSRMEGLVYHCFDDLENIVKAFPLPAGTEYVAGVDWGFTAPFAITVRAITPDGFHYQIAELYRTGMTPSQKVEAAKRLKLVYGIRMFYCDPEEPASIAEFNANGLSAVAADNNVKRGVDLHFELIRSRRFKVFEESSPHSLDEYESYHWPAPGDLKPDQDEKDPNPVAQNNHAMDSARYITIMTVRGFDHDEGARRKRAIVPNETPVREDHHKETERLKRGSRGHTEDWS